MKLPLLSLLIVVDPVVAKQLRRDPTSEKKDHSSTIATNLKSRRLASGDLFSSPGNSKNCPNSQFTEDVPELGDLEDWTKADYDEGTGITGSFTEKKYAYNSAMVLGADPSSLFRDDYELTNSETAYPRDGSSPGVPGAFDYEEGYEKWGGDEVTLGRQRYPAMIAHFGHSHILTVITKINILRRNPCDETESQNLMMEHLLEGSKNIFAWFGGLIDADGNPANFGSPPQIVQDLAGLMSMLIFGDNTAEGGVVDLNVLFGGIGGLIQAAGESHPNFSLLQAEAGRVTAYLTDVLKLDSANPIPFKAWYQLMDVHQSHTFNNYLRYREVYGTKDTDSDYDEYVAQAEEEMQALMQTGPQMAAFFSVFYSFVNVLDKFYVPTSDDDEYAIPIAIMDENINYTQEKLKTQWTEHVVMFNDYSKAAALGDEQAMFEITLNMLDSCTPLATSMAEVFYRFDRLVRGRGVFPYLIGLFTPV